MQEEAQHLPNLNSLRRFGGKGRNQVRGGRANQGNGIHRQTDRTKDKIIQNTDDDAATSRLSAVQAGYLNDPFAEYLTSIDNVTRRLPLMNRGLRLRMAIQ